MRQLKKWALSTGAIIALSSAAQAGIVITVENVGDNIYAAFSGTINTNAFTSSAVAGGSTVGLYPVSRLVFFGGNSPASIYTASSVQQASSFGTISSIPFTNKQGDVLNIANNTVTITRDASINADGITETLSGSMESLNNDVISAGLTRGTYTWTFTTGDVTETITMEVIPEPATFGLFAVTGCCIFGLRRRFCS